MTMISRDNRQQYTAEEGPQDVSVPVANRCRGTCGRNGMLGTSYMYLYACNLDKTHKTMKRVQ